MIKLKLPKDSLIHIMDPVEIGSDEDNRLAPMSQWLVNNKHLYAGKRVLDLGSNAGHFPLLYAENGARAVLAVEPRKVFKDVFFQLIDLYRPQLRATLDWIVSDIRAFTPSGPHDVVSCLGLLYHVEDGWAHLKRIVDQSGAGTLIFDTMLFPVSHTRLETGRTNKNCARLIERVPQPSKESVESTFDSFGWSHQLVLKDWTKNSRGMWMCKPTGPSGSSQPR